MYGNSKYEIEVLDNGFVVRQKATERERSCDNTGRWFSGDPIEKEVTSMVFSDENFEEFINYLIRHLRPNEPYPDYIGIRKCETTE